MMADWEKELLPLIDDLLADGLPRSTRQVLAELQVEHPGVVEGLAARYVSTYGLTGCGERMAPYTLVAQGLDRLRVKGRVDCYPHQQEEFWQRAGWGVREWDNC